jgi:uncharacterized RDD family membrane protein YckC
LQKITEIKERYTVKRKEKVNGIETLVEKNLVRYRDVPYVDGWARFGHFLLDRVFLYIFSILFWIGAGVVLSLTGYSYLLDDPNLSIYDTLISWLLLYPAYYFIFEAAMQASPAKAILGRVVVDEYGNKPPVKSILIRSFSRCVPFEPLSCFGSTGWHDDWSKTFVIRKKDLEELRLFQKINNIEAPVDSGDKK